VDLFFGVALVIILEHDIGDDGDWVKGLHSVDY